MWPLRQCHPITLMWTSGAWRQRTLIACRIGVTMLWPPRQCHPVAIVKASGARIVSFLRAAERSAAVRCRAQPAMIWYGFLMGLSIVSTHRFLEYGPPTWLALLCLREDAIVEVSGGPFMTLRYGSASTAYVRRPLLGSCPRGRWPALPPTWLQILQPLCLAPTLWRPQAVEVH